MSSGVAEPGRLTSPTPALFTQAQGGATTSRKQGELDAEIPHLETKIPCTIPVLFNFDIGGVTSVMDFGQVRSHRYL